MPAMLAVVYPEPETAEQAMDRIDWSDFDQIENIGVWLGSFFVASRHSSLSNHGISHIAGATSPSGNPAYFAQMAESQEPSETPVNHLPLGTDTRTR